MTTEEVLSFFADAENRREIATKLRDSGLDLGYAETVSVSLHSPGPVQNDETLARLLFSPLFVDADTGAPTTAALKDAESRGLSVDRLSIFNADHVHERGYAKEKADGARKTGMNKLKYEGFIHVRCGSIRALRDVREQRQFYVFDTAAPENLAHADVCHGRFANEKEKRLARVGLMNEFEPLVRPRRQA